VLAAALVATVAAGNGGRMAAGEKMPGNWYKRGGDSTISQGHGEIE